MVIVKWPSAKQKVDHAYFECLDLQFIFTCLGCSMSTASVENLYKSFKDKKIIIFHCNQESSVSKLGVAAPTSADLLDLDLVSGAGGGDSKEAAQELLRRQQVQEFVSKLSPEQVALQQQRVQVREKYVTNVSMFDKKIFSEG